MGDASSVRPGTLRKPASRPVLQPRPDWHAAYRAAYEFSNRFPDWSALATGQGGPSRVLYRPVMAAGMIGVSSPELFVSSFVVLGLAIFSLASLYRIGLALTGLWARPQRVTPSKRASWPVYTILIALKDEAAIAPQLSAAMAALDYPDDRLDLKLLLETGDEVTRSALLAEDWPPGTELLVLPPGDPQTKPRALNYGLFRARGQYVVVYDAEDIPDPAQLKLAVDRFSAASGRIACLQAPLIGQTSSHSWLARQWALEYAVQFQRVIPALARLGLPVALGGTSNHFETAILRRLGGWDAWNVTEDADLGLRLARCGHGVGVLPAPTWERPPEDFRVWVSQRSRWLKGYMQTWRVLMRQPLRAVQDMGWGAFASVQLTLGIAILAALIHGPWALWCMVCLAAPGLELGPVATVMFALSIVSGWVLAAVAADRRSGFGLREALSQPFYWPLQSLAMMRAIYGLVRTPHFWAKTPH